ncbi:MAG: hypothetical protein QF464_04605, partial [Myxococcota bacterium]|nr:hypothetical protein [Myxococcota bacterium]
MIRRAAGPICVTLLLFATPTALADDPKTPSRITPDSDDDFDDEFDEEEEPAKTAPAKTEPAKTAPAKTEPAKTA